MSESWSQEVLASFRLHAGHVSTSNPHPSFCIKFPEWNVLRVPGTVCDEMSTVLTSPPSWSEVDWYAGRSSKRLRDLCQHIETCKSFYVHQTKDRKRYPEVDVEAEIAHTFLAVKEGSSNNVDSCERIIEAASLPNDHNRSCLSRLSQIWPGRGFFVTKQGRTGVGSSSIRPGDKVCVFFECSPCYVLRKHSDGHHWQFRYEAYLYGMMSGQVFGMVERGEVQEELFDII